MGKLLSSVLAVAGLLAITACAPVSGTSTYPNASLLAETGWLSERLNDPQVRIIDVRGSNSYEEGHIPGSVYLNMGDMVDEKASVRGMLAPLELIEARLGSLGIGRESTVVVYDDSGGLWASRLFWIMDYFQHKDLRVLNGGFSKWTKEARPLSQVSPAPTPTAYKGNPLPARSVDRQWVFSNLKNSDIRLVDARTPEEYSGVDKAGNKRAGHIPGAVNAEWSRNLNQDKTWKSARDLKKIFEEQGVTGDKQVVTYCQTGTRASHDYFTLRLLGYQNVSLYDGSWEEWGNELTLPIIP